MLRFLAPATQASYPKLMGTPANIEAMTAFAEKRQPNFDGIEGG